METTKKTDAEIQLDVLRELAWDTRVAATEVGVSVHRRAVTLTGVVDSWAKRLAAQEAAHRVAGVLDVANDLTVKLPGSMSHDDTELATAVRFALRWDVRVPEELIQTTVSAGVVTLEGTVDFMSQREDAERAVRHLTGVREVRNAIHVRPAAVAGEVKSAIESALRRHAEREATHIALEVNNGAVAVSGEVQSWTEKQLVLGAARGTAGVRTVEDHLYIGT